MNPLFFHYYYSCKRHSPHIARPQPPIEDRLTGSPNRPTSQHESAALAGKRRIQLDSCHSDKNLIDPLSPSGKTNWFDSTEEAI